MTEELSKHDRALIAGIAARLNAENKAASEKASSRRASARAEAERLAVAFAEADPGTRKVVLFGSLLEGRRYRENSDIDLAVEGGSYATLLRIAEASEFEVDLIPVEDMEASFRALALSEGETLYERDAGRSG